MRIKRSKAYRKLMNLYCMSFRFREPYQVLVDSGLCKASITQGLDLSKQLRTVLQGSVKPMITQCCIHELYLQGKAQQPAVDLAKTFERRKCNHREPVPGDDCLASVVGETNKHRYVIATQSQALRSQLRDIPAVPLVHINRSVMILEPPSRATLEAKENAEEQTLHPTVPELATIASTSKTEEAPVHKKRKGPKGPNPLSVKKKTKPEAAAPKSKPKDVKAQAGEKRRRVDGEGAMDSAEAIGEAGSGHKRKRRRKVDASTTLNVAEESLSVS